jgi:hypothetical protein
LVENKKYYDYFVGAEGIDFCFFLLSTKKASFIYSGELRKYVK